jgi:cation transport ATPase
VNLRRVLLIINGLAFAGYGVASMLRPGIPATFSKITLDNPIAFTEVTAMYGGLQAGLGIVFLASAFRTHTLQTGLLVMIAAMGGLAVARAYGIALYGIDWYNGAACAYEAGSVVVAIVALTRSSESGSVSQTRLAAAELSDLVDPAASLAGADPSPAVSEKAN